MLYIERQPSRRSVALLVTLTVLLYLFALPFLELRSSDEALYAAFARDMLSGGNLFKTHLQGVPVNAFPLYSWMIALCSGFQSPTVFTVRLPSVLALVGLATLCGLTAKRIHSPFAGAIAASMALTSVVSFRLGSRAQAELLHALLINGAWTTLFFCGQVRKKWYLAWGGALALVFLAVLAVGAKALFFFYFPLFFMGVPFRMTNRMQAPPHVFMAAAFTAVVILWLCMVPDQPFFSWNTVFTTSRSDEGLLRQFILFPLKCLIYMLPWSVFTWAPFCQALRRFESDSPACSYFRTIIISIGLLVWLLPGTSPLLLFSVFGPLCILVGVHFEIILRRHQHIFIKAVRILSWICLACTILSLFFWTAVATGHIVIDDFPLSVTIFCCAFLIFSLIIIWTQLLFCRRLRSFRTSILWSIAGFRILSITMVYTLSGWADGCRKLHGQTLATLCHPVPGMTSPPATAIRLQDMDQAPEVVYLHSPLFYSTETFYMGKRIIHISNPIKDLPEDEPTVYVLSSRTPAVPSRSWEPVSLQVDMNQRLEVNITTNHITTGNHRALLFISRVPGAAGEDAVPAPLQLFRGTLRTATPTQGIPLP